MHIFNVLISQISRFLTYCQSTLDLLHYLISNYDFDENFAFRVDLEYQINYLIKEQKQSSIFLTNTSPYIWSFRQQIIYSILNFCDPESDPTNLLFSLFCYTPNSIYKMFLNDQKFKQNFGFFYIK